MAIDQGSEPNNEELLRAAGASGVPEDPAISISELTQRIRRTLEPNFLNVCVLGEISNYRPATSGHAYFSLKDNSSSISAAIFGWGAQKAKGRFKFDLKDGMQVFCRGRVTVYGPRGTYQLTVEHIEPVGAGALQLQFEQLKQKLFAEGLFKQERKRPLPAFPRSIAVVTSPSGAAIQDMLNILKRRAPHLVVRIVPAVVQGESAPRQIIEGLAEANRLKLGEIVVLARGGGSIEDLWCFNDENLARAIAQSPLPVISAVGHEIDFTISDFVSDLRAPTPSAAAEIVSGHWVESRTRVGEWRHRLVQVMLRDLQTKKLQVNHLAKRVVSPRDRLREQTQRCDDWALRLERAIRLRIEQRKARVGQLDAKLGALSPLRVLERGYAIVHDTERDGTVIRSVEQIKSGMGIRLRFKDGTADAQAI